MQYAHILNGELHFKLGFIISHIYIIHFISTKTLSISLPNFRSRKDIEDSIEFFTVCTKSAEMAILYSKDLTTTNKELPPVGLDLVQGIIAGLGVQCLTI